MDLEQLVQHGQQGTCVDACVCVCVCVSVRVRVSVCVYALTQYMKDYIHKQENLSSLCLSQQTAVDQ